MLNNLKSVAILLLLIVVGLVLMRLTAVITHVLFQFVFWGGLIFIAWMLLKPKRS